MPDSNLDIATLKRSVKFVSNPSLGCLVSYRGCRLKRFHPAHPRVELSIISADSWGLLEYAASQFGLVDETDSLPCISSR